MTNSDSRLQEGLGFRVLGFGLRVQYGLGLMCPWVVEKIGIEKKTGSFVMREQMDSHIQNGIQNQIVWSLLVLGVCCVGCWVQLGSRFLLVISNPKPYAILI